MKSVLIFSYIILFYSCGDNDARIVNKWEAEENTRGLDVNKDSYKKAILSAQKTIDTFVTLLNKTAEIERQYFIKMRFVQGGDIEHMWVEADTSYNGFIFGSIGNDPIKVTNVKYGDKVQVRFNDVEDYVIYEGDSVILGNFINLALGK